MDQPAGLTFDAAEAVQDEVSNIVIAKRFWGDRLASHESDNPLHRHTKVDHAGADVRHRIELHRLVPILSESKMSAADETAERKGALCVANRGLAGDCLEHLHV